MIMPRRVHTIINREIATNQVRAHSGTLTSKRLTPAYRIRLVFAIIDAHGARVAAGIGEGVVGGFGPVAAATEAWNC